MNSFLALLQRDVRLSFVRGSEGMTGIVFFMVVVSLLAISFGSDPALIKSAAGAVIWVAALLAALLSLEGLYHRDFDDGSFDMMLMSPVSPLTLVIAKMAAHWLLSGVTFVIASLVASAMLLLPMDIFPVVFLSLLLGTLYMSLIGGLGAILTFGTRRPGLLVTLLVLPLMIPMLILGLLAIEAGLAALPARPYILLQLSLLLVALPAVPWLASIILPAQVRSS